MSERNADRNGCRPELLFDQPIACPHPWLLPHRRCALKHEL
jgi:hypothetical protein